MQASTRRASADRSGRLPARVDIDPDAAVDGMQPTGPARGDGPLRLELGANLAAAGLTLGVCLATALALTALLHLLG